MRGVEVDLLLVIGGRGAPRLQRLGEARRIDHTRTVLTSTEAFVRKNPQTVLALLRAYVKAQAFVMDPKNFAVQIPLDMPWYEQNYGAALDEYLKIISA